MFYVLNKNCNSENSEKIIVCLLGTKLVLYIFLCEFLFVKDGRFRFLRSFFALFIWYQKFKKLLLFNSNHTKDCFEKQ